MNKKVMALAVAGALSAPAAALAQVQIGGSITVLWYVYDPDNKSVASQGDILEPSEPEIYIRSAEKLGGGTSVWFQCASSIDGFIGGGSSETGWCTRNSGIGFQGSFGNFFFGNWDTPAKLVQNRIRGWFSGTNPLVGGSMRLLANSSSSGNTNPNPATVPANGNAAANSFYRRQPNSVNYHSPNWGGFSVAAAFSSNNESTGIPDSSGLTPRLYGVNGVYASGPFWVGLAMEVHKDYNPGGTVGYNGGTDTNTTIGAGFQMAGFNVRAGYLQNKYELNTAAVSNEVKTKGFGVYADWNIQGPHTVRAQFATVDDPTGNAGSRVGSYTVGNDRGANVFTFAYSYALSKRTEVSLAYNAMDNDTNASFGLGKASVTVGGKQTAVGAVLKHRF